MKMRWFRILGIVLAVVLIGGLALSCAAPAPPAPPGAAPGLEKELAASKAQIVKLEKEIAALKAPPKKVKPIVLKMAMYHGSASLYYRIYSEYLPLVEKNTQGRVKIEIFPGGALAKGPAQLEGVQTGVCDIAYPWGGYMSKTVPLLGLEALPIWKDFQSAHYAFDDPAMVDLYNQAYAAKGLNNVRLFIIKESGPRMISTTKKQIKVPSDLKGLKIKAMAGPEADFCKLVGASATVITPAEIYEALERGILDGTVSSVTNLADPTWNWREVCEYVNAYGFGVAGLHMLFNKKAFDAIPADLTPIVENTIRAAHMAVRYRTIEDYEHMWSTMVPEMMTVYTPTPEERKVWSETVSPLIDTFLEKTGALGQKALDIAYKYNK